jgi:hypothetical protein
MLDFNRTDLSEQSISESINALIEAAEPPGKNYRQYLGASAIGNECLRKIQYDWSCDPRFPARVKDIFERGHFFEDVTRQHLITAGFKFAPTERLAFSALDGLFQGHADGIILGGPGNAQLKYPYLWEHKCLNAKGWHAIACNGLMGLYKTYAGQVATYQSRLDVTNPALFSVVNDSCERLHFLVPFDAALSQEMTERASTIIVARRRTAAADH